MDVVEHKQRASLLEELVVARVALQQRELQHGLHARHLRRLLHLLARPLCNTPHGSMLL